MRFYHHSGGVVEVRLIIATFECNNKHDLLYIFPTFTPLF